MTIQIEISEKVAAVAEQLGGGKGKKALLSQQTASLISSRNSKDLNMDALVSPLWKALHPNQWKKLNEAARELSQAVCFQDIPSDLPIANSEEIKVAKEKLLQMNNQEKVNDNLANAELEKVRNSSLLKKGMILHTLSQGGWIAEEFFKETLLAKKRDKEDLLNKIEANKKALPNLDQDAHLVPSGVVRAEERAKIVRQGGEVEALHHVKTRNR